MLPSADDAAEDLAYNVGHGSVARFVGDDERRGPQLWAAPHPLLDADRARHAGQLLHRRGPGQARRLRPDPHRSTSPGSSPCRSAVLRLGQPRPRTSPTATTWSGRYPWIDGVKTGHTSGRRLRPGRVRAQRGHGADQRRARDRLRDSRADANTLALLDYGFANFRVWTPVRAGQVMARPTVKDRPGLRARRHAARGFTRVLPRVGPRARQGGRPAPARWARCPPRRWSAPRWSTDGRRVLARIPLVLAQTLPAVSGLTLAARFITRPLTLAGHRRCRRAAPRCCLRNVRRRRRIGRRGRELEAA